jgi:hypothetical protein
MDQSGATVREDDFRRDELITASSEKSGNRFGETDIRKSAEWHVG